MDRDRGPVSREVTYAKVCARNCYVSGAKTVTTQEINLGWTTQFLLSGDLNQQDKI
jgi:hypothetical protein